MIDTVWKPYATAFVDNLAQEIDLHALDAIIINHGEVDHSGALPELMRHIPDTPIYCTKKAIDSLTVSTMKTGISIRLRLEIRLISVMVNS